MILEVLINYLLREKDGRLIRVIHLVNSLNTKKPSFHFACIWTKYIYKEFFIIIFRLKLFIFYWYKMNIWHYSFWRRKMSFWRGTRWPLHMAQSLLYACYQSRNIGLEELKGRVATPKNPYFYFFFLLSTSTFLKIFQILSWFCYIYFQISSNFVLFEKNSVIRFIHDF